MTTVDFLLGFLATDVAVGSVAVGFAFVPGLAGYRASAFIAMEATLADCHCYVQNVFGGIRVR